MRAGFAVKWHWMAVHSANSTRVKRAGLIAGIGLAVLVQLFPAPAALDREAWLLASLALMMAAWWATEAIPIAATALIPLALFPFFGVTTMDAAAGPYASPIVMLLLGGFIIALGIERWHLHARIALNVVAAFGARPSLLILGFMVAGAVLSMWISNTATTLMMLPIALKVAEAVKREGVDIGRFAPALVLGVAYACSTGGIATPVGTPTNLIGLAFLQDNFDTAISFPQWMAAGVPASALIVPALWLLLTRLVFPLRAGGNTGGRQALEAERAALGPMGAAERRVAMSFGIVAVLWMGRELPGALLGQPGMEWGWNPLLAWLAGVVGLPITPQLGNAQIAVAGAVAMFLIPAGTAKRGEALMDWQTAARLPWHVIILFGGGLSLASAIQGSGLADWIGSYLTGIAAWPLPLLVLVLAFIVVFLTELTSNVATVSGFLPVLAALAANAGVPPSWLIVPVAMAASCAYMLPVATAPNAIAYASGEVSMAQMIRAGARMNLIAAPVIALIGSLIVPRVMG